MQLQKRNEKQSLQLLSSSHFKSPWISKKIVVTKNGLPNYFLGGSNLEFEKNIESIKFIIQTIKALKERDYTDPLNTNLQNTTLIMKNDIHHLTLLW